MGDRENDKHRARESIQSAATCLDEKLNCMNLPEETKQKVLEDFRYLLNKSREYPEGEKADFINNQICNFLDTVDAMFEGDEEGDKAPPPVADGQSSANTLATHAPDQQKEASALPELAQPPRDQQGEYGQSNEEDGSDRKADKNYHHRDPFRQKEDVNDLAYDKDRFLRRRIQDAAGNLDEKIQRLDISEDAKHSILDNLNYLLTKSRECQEGQSAEFVNDQICRLLDHIDSLSSDDQEGQVDCGEDDHGDGNDAMPEEHSQDEADKDDPPHHNYGRDQLLRLMPDDKPDVVLNVPNVSVDLIDFEINNLSARVAVDATVAQDAVKLFVGVDVHLERVKLKIENVQVCAQLIVRLDTVRHIVDRALEAIDSDKHHSVLGMTQGLLKR